MMLRRTLIASALLTCISIEAEPWIDTTDPYLRQSIEQLVSYGVIKRPINNYPLMWQGIAQDLSQAKRNQLPKETEFAFNHVRHALRFAQKGSRSGVKVKLNSRPSQTQSFAERYQEEAAIQGYSVLMGNNVTAKVSVQAANNANNEKTLSYDDSYLAVLMGNWVISAEQVNRWWGPANDNALMLSNNATPMKAVRLSRFNSDYFGPNLLSFVGNWQFTALIGEQKYPGQTPITNKFWGARFAATPLTGLEIAYSQTAQFDASNQADDLGDLGNVMLGKNKIDPKTGLNYYNQLSSLDIKYSTVLFNHSAALYGEWAGDKQSSLLPESTNYTLGAELFLGDVDYVIKSYIEHSNTKQTCTSLTEQFHCGYQHPAFSDGYQHYQQMIGASIGAFATSNTLGLQYHQTNGIAAYTKLRHIEFDLPTSQLNETTASDQLQLEVGYQQGVFKGLFKVSASAWREKNQLDNQSKNYSAIRMSWEYRF